MFLNYILGKWGTCLYSVHFNHKPTHEAFLVLITKKLTIYLLEIKKLSVHSETSEKNACQKIRLFLGGLEIILYFSHFLVEYLVATLNFFDKVLSWKCPYHYEVDRLNLLSHFETRYKASELLSFQVFHDGYAQNVASDKTLACSQWCAITFSS